MSNKFEDDLNEIISMAMSAGFKDEIDEQPHVDNVKDLLKEHITENESGAFVSPHTISKDFKEFLDE